jgi:NAD(P)-dependent dehydrogenase (short-subunit alcohol dehydrogenase family)
MVRRGAQAGGRLVGTDWPAITQGQAMPASKTSEPRTGRVALVTGAAHGIGQAIAAGLAERVTRIVLGDIDEVSEASDLIGATGHPAVPVTPDVSDPSWIEAARDADPGLGGFHADVASAKSFYSDMFGWETGDQPIGAFTSTVMRSADAGDEQRSERHHAAQPDMAAARATPRWASRSPTAMLRQPPGRQSSILSRASLVTRFGRLGSAAAGRSGAAW